MSSNCGTFGTINVSGRYSSIKNLKAWFIGWLPIVLGLAAWIGLSAGSSEWISLPFTCFGIFTAYAISVVIHEMAHFVAGRVLGLKPWCLRIGHGETVFDKQFDSFRLILKWMPYSGAVYPSSYITRAKQFLMILAGPLTSALFAIVFFLITLALDKTDDFDSALMQMFLANAYITLVTAIPYYSRKGQPNDAMIIVNLFRKTSPRSPEFIKTVRDVHPSWFWVVKEVSANTSLAPYRKALDNPNLTLEERCKVLDTFVTGVLMYGATELLEEAERYSEELFRLQPTEWTVKGTRGGVLVEKNDLAAGISMLTEVMTNDTSAFDRAISSSFLALAEFKQGNRAEALRWLDISRSLDPRCPSMLRVAALLKSSREQSDSNLPSAASR